MPAVDDEAAFAQAVRERAFHELRLLVRHRIEVGLEFRHQTLAELADDAGCLDAVFVVLEPLLG